MKVLTANLEITNDIGEFAGYYIATVYGGLGKLHGYEFAIAHFGTFKRNGRYLEYSATVWRDGTGRIDHDFDSEFCDDLIALRNGNVELMN